MGEESKNGEALPHGTEHDRMKLDPLIWKNITYWGLPSAQNPKIYRKFEVISFTKMVWYKLVCANPFAELDNPDKKPHPSGWDLMVYEFGSSKPVGVLTEHPIFKDATFGELIAAIAVLVDEQEHPTEMGVLPSTKELKSLRSKWRRWMKGLPEWANMEE